MTATRKEIEDVKHTVEGLADMARKLGYRSRFGQLVMANGATASDLFDFLEDNPGACGAVVEWVLENGVDREGDPLEDEDCDVEELREECGHLWAGMKASHADVCEDVLRITGEAVPDGAEDAMAHLDDGQVKAVLLALREQAAEARSPDAAL